MAAGAQPTRDLRGWILREVATTRIYDFLRETPLVAAPGLSRLARAPTLLKREDLQPIFSFKIRGAYHKLAALSEKKRARGVVAASAGNHAQGVALAARRLGCKAIIAMPRHTQRIKVDAVRALGAKTVLTGETFDDAYAAARALARAENAIFVPPFDDKGVIAGNATIAAEILRQHPGPLAAIFCAVGGGGLAAGIAAYVKAVRPEIKVIGVESADSAGLSASLAAGKIVTLPTVGFFADAVAVRRVGDLPFAIARECLDEVVVVDNDAVCAAIMDIYNDTRAVVEPSGALAAAGLKRWAQGRRTKKGALAAIACGANMNFDRLRFVAERAELGEQREALFGATIPEKPGSFRRFCKLLGRRQITEFNYRFADSKEAHIFVGVEIDRAAERAEIVRTLRQGGIEAVDLSADEMAKLHIRHMVGGRARAADEILCRFEFPERPGALMHFLSRLGDGGARWNISLFHYRNHGADYGRVLVGVQAPPAERARFDAFLDGLGYRHARESDNPAYKMFLRPPEDASAD